MGLYFCQQPQLGTLCLTDNMRGAHYLRLSQGLFLCAELVVETSLPNMMENLNCEFPCVYSVLLKLVSYNYIITLDTPKGKERNYD